MPQLKIYIQTRSNSFNSAKKTLVLRCGLDINYLHNI